jgi:hypothetical protein
MPKLNCSGHIAVIDGIVSVARGQLPVTDLKKKPANGERETRKCCYLTIDLSLVVGIASLAACYVACVIR